MAYEIYTLLAGLIVGAAIVFIVFRSQRALIEHAIRQSYEAKFEEWKVTELAEAIEKRTTESLDRARAVLKGKIGEQLAPLLPEFLEKYSPSDARFMGTPIDYIIFRNMSKLEEGTEPVEVVLLDVKTGTAALSKIQKMIKAAVEEGRVKFETLRLGGSTAQAQ
jgi:predicted Holliday junction resolvase-like endonuclease